MWQEGEDVFDQCRNRQNLFALPVCVVDEPYQAKVCPGLLQNDAFQVIVASEFSQRFPFVDHKLVVTVKHI